MKQLDIFTLTERELEVPELPKYVGKKMRLIGLREGDPYEMAVKLKEVTKTEGGTWLTLEPRTNATFTKWIKDGEPTRLWIRKATKEGSK